MGPNLSEEQQVIMINVFGANTPKGIHICFVPTSHIGIRYKSIEEVKTKQSVSIK